jgi:hypothetical protein
MLLFNIPFLKTSKFSGLWNLPKLKCDHTPLPLLAKEGGQRKGKGMVIDLKPHSFI